MAVGVMTRQPAGILSLSQQLKAWLLSDERSLPLRLLWRIQRELEAIERGLDEDADSCAWCGRPLSADRQAAVMGNLCAGCEQKCRVDPCTIDDCVNG